MNQLMKYAEDEQFMDYAQAVYDALSTAHDTAVSKGWWEAERPESEIFANYHAEVSEAWEAWRGSMSSEKIPGFSGVEEELADLCIRVADYVTWGDRQLSFSEFSYMPVISGKVDFSSAEFWYQDYNNPHPTFPTFVCRLHAHIAREIPDLVEQVLVYCWQTDLRLLEAIKAKMEYNKSRTYRHGGKLA